MPSSELGPHATVSRHLTSPGVGDLRPAARADKATFSVEILGDLLSGRLMNGETTMAREKPRAREQARVAVSPSEGFGGTAARVRRPPVHTKYERRFQSRGAEKRRFLDRSV